VVRGPATTDEDTTLQQQPVSADAFRGRLTILSGPRNGSGATRTIAQLKEKAGAAIIGEDSAGSAEGPTSGSLFLLKLPASGIKVRIPEAWNRTAIAHFDAGKGVAVDVLVVPTLADLEAGRDRAVEVARAASLTAIDARGLVEKALAGSWTGTLDYRDYSDDTRDHDQRWPDARLDLRRWSRQDRPLLRKLGHRGGWEDDNHRQHRQRHRQAGVVARGRSSQIGRSTDTGAGW
jgi:hypothetical protein